ncbi:hypothetical protein R3P38DRAFT_3384555 [Favolaschia claudopus]|uniref:F-box domain-containing protein n=1 Tax=Favolaschia claudopus TaxID=2862362 RepID=A0AAW0E825_9AGAR
MSQHTTFPNELWAEICSYLPSDALRNLSSTHHPLYDLVRPLGFTEYKVYPYPYDFYPQKRKLDNAIDRLAFYSSPKMAPNIRTCTARWNPQKWQGSPQREDQGSEHVLMKAFFAAIPKFTALQKFYADRIQFTQTGLTNLCALPALRLVDLSSCTVANGEHIDTASLTLRVESFTSCYDYQMNDLWDSLLSRTTLRYLDFADLKSVKDLQPFPSVHTLKLREFPMMPYDIFSFFSRFPNLRIFRSEYYGVLRNLSPAQEASIFPILEEYTGAYENLRIFILRPTLTHIELDSGFSVQNLLKTVLGHTSFPNITSFKARFTSDVTEEFSQMEFNALLTLFPLLSTLDLTLIPDAQEDGGFTPQATAFLSNLPSNALLPRTLKTLLLEWDFPYEYGSTESAMGHDPAAPPPEDIPDFPSLRAALRQRCPELTHIMLNGYHFGYVWWKTDWVWEAVAHSYDELGPIQEKRNERMHGPPVLLS